MRKTARCKYAVCFPRVPILCDFFFFFSLWPWSDEPRSGHALTVSKAIKACACVCVHSCWLRVTHLHYYYDYAAFSLSAPSRREKVTSGSSIYLNLFKEQRALTFHRIRRQQTAAADIRLTSCCSRRGYNVRGGGNWVKNLWAPGDVWWYNMTISFQMAAFLDININANKLVVQLFVAQSV